ncbi:hypothetical protein BCP78_0033 [Bacillus phage BCP78]|uniref:Uncharacterized protein n=3 Tax=Tsarbombavirus BCP78 TaxID=1985182 RepID=J9Q8Y5_9CAUD|nr:hypothetical protein BCP78_0033 [Bacillus phage BCP78]YP_009783398.1 hypothetical protein QLX27_gp025 [Bacillus phage BCU4]AEW47040.1 hypothetical protein BCP78_0033 [Bacillus phage BCP78]AEW47531.1 hypothetical protein BCU4_0025 [Bacillus phage BCU4]AQN32636.1 hypothetical protein BCP12_236 [Bacillus phage BCP12]
MSAKYEVGDEFQLQKGSDSVNLVVLFVPPIDGYGVQHYLCSVYSGYNDGAEHMTLHLKQEKIIDRFFEKRKQPFIWEEK